MIVIGGIALLVFGPDQLPKVARKAGGLIRDVQLQSQSFIREMERAADDVDFRDAMRSPVERHAEPAPVEHFADPAPAPEPYAYESAAYEPEPDARPPIPEPYDPDPAPFARAHETIEPRARPQEANEPQAHAREAHDAEARPEE
jgi:Sec-independent protein translocase protein TatA